MIAQVFLSGEVVLCWVCLMLWCVHSPYGCGKGRRPCVCLSRACGVGTLRGIRLSRWRDGVDHSLQSRGCCGRCWLRYWRGSTFGVSEVTPGVLLDVGGSQAWRGPSSPPQEQWLICPPQCYVSPLQVPLMLAHIVNNPIRSGLSNKSFICLPFLGNGVILTQTFYTGTNSRGPWTSLEPVWNLRMPKMFSPFLTGHACMCMCMCGCVLHYLAVWFTMIDPNDE